MLYYSRVDFTITYVMREGAGGLQSLHLSTSNMELKWPKNEEHYDPVKISWLKFHSSPITAH